MNRTYEKRRRRERCIECGKPSRRHKRCFVCRRGQADDDRAKRKERKEVLGLCGDCGKRPPLRGGERCFECSIGKPRSEVEDFVDDLFVPHPRIAKKMAQE